MFTFVLYPQYGPVVDLPGQRRPVGSKRLRLDYQRDLLEYKKMNHAELARYLPTAIALEEIRERHQLVEARRMQPSMSFRLRQAIGRFLIATGERIRPETADVERASYA